MRRLTISLLGLLVVLLAGVTVLWYLVTTRMRDGVELWRRQMAQLGWTATLAAPQAGGWPFEASLVLPDFRLASAGGDPRNAASWQAARVVLHLRLLHPTRLVIAPEGAQLIGFGPDHVLPYAAQAMQAEIPLGRTPPTSLDATAHAIQATLPAPPDATGQPPVVLAIAEAELHLHWRAPATAADTAADAAAPLLDMALHATGIATTPDRLPTPAPTIDKLALEGAVLGPLPAGRTPAEQLTLWRDNGGMLDLRRLALQSGQVTLDLRARLGLDAALQPQGQGEARLRGVTQLTDGLAARSIITPMQARATGALLGLMAQPPDEAGLRQAVLPLVLRNRQLNLGGIPLLRLPVIAWPGSE